MGLRLRCRTARAGVLFVLLPMVAGAGTAGAESPSASISLSARQQIQALAAEKQSRTPAQRKVDSNLLYEAKQRRGLAIAAGVPTLQTFIPVGSRGEVVVDITARITDSLLATLARLGGSVVDVQARYRSVRAVMPLQAVEMLAEHPDVIFVQPKQEAMLNDVVRSAGAFSQASPTRGVTPLILSSMRPGFTTRATAVRSQLAAALSKRAATGTSGRRPPAMTATNVSEGVVTHRADLAMSTFGATGAGVKVGVLSDGVDSLAALQGTGDLPAGVTVLAGQAGTGDEGSAMLEIVHDMAPSAQLFFATAFTSITSFAQNIHDLRTAGCDVIIDDVGYFAETPFQKGQTASVVSNTNGGIVIQAVNDVTAAGALYFSSSANSGSKDKNTSGTWEGNFADAGPAGPPLSGAGQLHDFDPGAGVTAFNTITKSGGPTILFWSDPLGGSANDYDLFILNPPGTAVLGASTNSQTGTQDPFEGINGSPSNDRIVVTKVSGAARFLHLDTSRAQITFSTRGSTHGHNSPPSANAFGVAATPAAAAIGAPPNPTGPYPLPFNSTNTVEVFSSDGPRQFFFNADSTAITPGDFSSTGGQIVQQPLVTAADGVSCAAPGFNPFFGTSAAAPHAGAIAALVKSANGSLTATQISSILTSTAIDIEALGVDRDSGFGILDAFAAVQAAVLSITPTNTPTRTPTHTPGTPTSTLTPTNTPTRTQTNSPTITRTNTSTSTNTPTATATPTNTPTITFTSTFTNTPTHTPSITPSQTPTSTPTNTATNTQTNTRTNTPTATATPTNTPSQTPTSTPTNTPANTATPTNTASNTPSQTPTSTPTNTPTNTRTNTPTATITPSNTPTNTFTITRTNTPTNTPTPSQTPTNTLTNTPTNTRTNTPTPTTAPSNTPSPTPTNTPTTTATTTHTRTNTPTVTATPTNTPTNTFTFTRTNTPTKTPTPTNTLTITSFTASPPLPQPTGTVITWTATATGGVAPLQYFFALYSAASGTWSIAQPYSTSNTWMWTPTQAGQYAVQVWVKNNGSTNPYDAWAGSGFFNVTVPSSPPTITSFTASPPLPQPAGTVITWTATATGGVAPLQYQFLLYSAASGTWSIAQPYSTSNTWMWTPTQAGQYTVQVWVKNNGSTNPYDAWAGSGFFNVTVPSSPPTITSFTASPPLPQPAGTLITWTAMATGGVVPLQYQFLLYSAASGTWSIAQPYSTSNTWMWTPTQAGQYTVQVWVKNNGSTNPYDAWAGSGFFNVTSSSLTITSFTASPPLPQPAGTLITWTAMATGGVAPLQYQFLLYSAASGTWSIAQPYSTSNTWMWTPTQAGQYTVQVWVKNNGSTNPYDAWAGSGFFMVN